MIFNTIIIDFNLQELVRFVLDINLKNNIIDFAYSIINVELIQSNILLFFLNIITTISSLYHFSAKQGKELLKKIGQGLIKVGTVNFGYSGTKEMYKNIKGLSGSSNNGGTTTSGSGNGSGSSSSNKTGTTSTSSGTPSTK